MLEWTFHQCVCVFDWKFRVCMYVWLNILSLCVCDWTFPVCVCVCVTEHSTQRVCVCNFKLCYCMCMCAMQCKCNNTQELVVVLVPQCNPKGGIQVDIFQSPTIALGYQDRQALWSTRTTKFLRPAIRGFSPRGGFLKVGTRVRMVRLVVVPACHRHLTGLCGRSPGRSYKEKTTCFWHISGTVRRRDPGPRLACSAPGSTSQNEHLFDHSQGFQSLYFGELAFT